MKNAYLLSTFCMAMLLVVVTGYAQDDAKIKALAEKSCECTKEISAEQPRDSVVSKINSCITASITEDQMNQTVAEMGTLADSLVTYGKDGDVAGNGKTYTIVVNKNFEEIQSYMFDNCPRVKTLMASNNGQLDYSMSKNKKALKLYEEGVEYEQREMYDMAIVSYNKALKIDSKFSFAWDNIGLCYRKRGNYKEAIRCYEESLKLDPKGTTPLQNIAVAYEYLKDNKTASATYERFIKLHPDNPEGFFGAGRTYYLSEEYAKGVDYMFKAYLLYTDTKSPYVNDALQNLRYYYKDLTDRGKIDIFKEAAKNNKVDIK